MEAPLTPFKTPKKASKDAFINIPPSPFLKKLGYGTGVQVYKFNRSPKINALKSPWAVKMVKSKINNSLYEQRLREEANLLRKMDNPYIVGFRLFGKNLDGKECLAMEECSNSLGNLIEERMEEIGLAFPPKIILKVALDISKALDYLHNTALLLHGDIKSHNILIKDDFNICKLCDFGVSLPLKPDGCLDMDKASNNQEYVGTVCWSAPEVLIEPQMITTKADIFAYGLVLWEMMALNIPHNNCESEIDFDISQIEETFGTRPDVPDEMLGNDIESYSHPLEIFWCCTEENCNDRPTAKHLTILINEMCEEK